MLDTIFEPERNPDLYGDITHVVRINYYPPRGDNKEGWDNIDIFGWLGYKMQIKVDFLCRDSILAAPLVLDLALFLDLAKRAGMSGVQEWLSFYWKSPQPVARGPLSRARHLHPAHEAEEHAPPPQGRRPDHPPRCRVLRLTGPSWSGRRRRPVGVAEWRPSTRYFSAHEPDVCLSRLRQATGQGRPRRRRRGPRRGGRLASTAEGARRRRRVGAPPPAAQARRRADRSPRSTCACVATTPAARSSRLTRRRPRWPYLVAVAPFLLALLLVILAFADAQYGVLVVAVVALVVAVAVPGAAQRGSAIPTSSASSAGSPPRPTRSPWEDEEPDGGRVGEPADDLGTDP